MIPPLLKCYQKYVVFSTKVDRGEGTDVANINDVIQKVCKLLLEIILEIPYIHLRMCSCESPEIQKCELCYPGMCWTSADTHSLPYTRRVIYAPSAASRFRDQALLSNDMGVEKLNEAERWLLITEDHRVHWCTARQREGETHLIGGEGLFLWHGRRIELYTCVNSDMFCTSGTFLLEYHLKSQSFCWGSDLFFFFY